MKDIDEIDLWLAEELPALAARHQIPGASVAVLAADQVVTHATGVLNARTGLQATTDSIFQIGSITKLFTATLIMQLHDAGALQIDAKVRTFLPEFQVRDHDAADRITVRHLLSHSAGFDGDLAVEVDWGDDCLRRVVSQLDHVGQVFPPGQMFSYNNLGYVVLGRILEEVRGQPFDACLRDHLLKPLGITHAAPTPWEAILLPAAVGHVAVAPDGTPVVATTYSRGRAEAPAGSLLAMRARDLLTFSHLHFPKRKSSQEALLSQQSVTQMQRPQVQQPNLGFPGEARGLGWTLYNWGGGRVIGHNGGTIGQQSFLRVAPDHGVAIAVLSNGGNSRGLFTGIVRPVLAELTGLQPPSEPTPAPRTCVPNPGRYIGRYANDMVETVVELDDETRLWLTVLPKDNGHALFANEGVPPRVELVAYSGDTLLAAQANGGIHSAYAFLGDDGRGRAQFVHSGRTLRRVGEHE